MQEQLSRLIKTKMKVNTQFNRVKTPHVLCSDHTNQLRRYTFYPEEFKAF